MIKKNGRLLIVLFLIMCVKHAHAVRDKFQQQDTDRVTQDWFLRDPETDKLQGTSTEKTYTFLQGKPSRKVRVAVIDSGIDVEHEDLKDIIWTNEDEIP